ncbi:VOC family protein [Salisaeta longa]|uniref:VOC family protein n=1 Tax=Salisaeta longa TaxID=503170 RepID=UPI0003B4C772|nr:VOC family protein [Salisaeta longa]
MPAPSLHGVLETSLYADAVDATAAFYETVLQLPVALDERPRLVSFRCGTGIVHVFDHAAAAADGAVPPHGTTGAGHVAFAVPTHALDAWRARLNQQDVPIEQEKTWPHGGHSLYLRDPAGNSVELATPTLWGAMNRDASLQQIRPDVPVDTRDQQPMERFQSRTLRPLCKLQNPLLLTTVSRYLQKYNTGFSQMDRADQEAKVRNLLKEDRRLKRSLVGLVAGHFTEDEYAFYLAHQREVRRRLVALFTQRVVDQLDALSAT